LRALGNDDPPARIDINGQSYERGEIYKHDSWAATAVYRGPAITVICKFNRQASFFGLPMAWLGRWLASHEAKVLRLLRDSPAVPRPLGAVKVNGRVLSNAVARTYIAGHPLGRYERVDDDFFPALERLLAIMHARAMAYVDLHKRENIIVSDDGRPYLVDFQISASPLPWPLNNPATRAITRMLQQSDLYHLLKHKSHHRPDQTGFDHHAMGCRRPWWIRLHRFVAVTPRNLRRRLLVLLGVRTGTGRAHSEHFAEDAVRREKKLPRRVA
jgi:hypothetical protein